MSLCGGVGAGVSVLVQFIELLTGRKKIKRNWSRNGGPI
jgi:hypothetical protein